MNHYYKREYQEYFVTYTLLLIILAVFLLITLVETFTNYRNLILLGAKINPLIEAGQYWRLITSVFLHHDFTHLLFNTYALMVLGKYSEKIFNHGKFLIIFLFSGLTGSLFSFIFSQGISVGASGAIFGLLGSIVAYGWKNTFLWRSGLITNLLVVLGINLFFGIIVPGIDNFAHLGGLLGGAFLGVIFRFIK